MEVTRQEIQRTPQHELLADLISQCISLRLHCLRLMWVFDSIAQGKEEGYIREGGGGPKPHANSALVLGPQGRAWEVGAATLPQHCGPPMR